MRPVLWYLEQDLAEPAMPQAWLSPLESKVLAGLRFEKRRRDWLRGRWCAKRLIAPVLRVVDWPRLSVLPASDGVPEVWLDGLRPGLSLSLSHTGDDALSMVCRGAVEIGCDLETIAHQSVGFEADYFTPRERRWLEGFAGEARAVATTLVWSAKESALKALRVGLTVDTRSVEVTLGGERTNLSPPRPVDGSLASVGVGAWSPLQVTQRVGDRIFHGWWRRERDRVVTMVMSPRPKQPERQEGRTRRRRSSTERSTDYGF